MPLTAAKAGTQHRRVFESRGKKWDYSIRLPKGYDGRKRFPVLVLPDHASVDPESGIQFWEQSVEVEKVILFRPVILRHQEDASRFPDQTFMKRDESIAAVMNDALTHLLNRQVRGA